MNVGFEHPTRQAARPAELIVKAKGSLEGRVEKKIMDTGSMITGSKSSVVWTKFSLLSVSSPTKGHGDYSRGVS